MVCAGALAKRSVLVCGAVVVVFELKGSAFAEEAAGTGSDH